MIGEFYDYGVNGEGDGGAPGSCMTTEFNKACKPDSGNFTALLEGAVGEQEVTVALSEDEIYADPATYTACVSEQDHVQLFA